MNHSEFDFHVGFCEPKVFMHLGVWEVCIPVIGIPINVVAIFVIMKLKEYKKSISHWYVLQLAWADLVFLALLPLMAHEHFTGFWNFSESLCKLFQGVFMIVYHAGILFLTVMSFDRYIAIVHPVNVFWRKFRTRKTSFIVTGMVWLVALAFSIPIIAWSKKSCGCTISSSKSFSIDLDIDDLEYSFNGRNDSEKSPVIFEYSLEDLTDDYSGTGSNGLNKQEMDGSGEEESCFQYVLPGFRIWLIMSFIFVFFLPIVIMVVCYSLILRRIFQPMFSSSGFSSSRCNSTNSVMSKKQNGKSEIKHRPGSTSSHQSRKMKQQRKITYIVVTLVLAFLVCWSPFQFVQLAKTQKLWNLSPEACHQLIDVATILAYANSMINPILYTVLGSKFYRRLSSALNGFGSRGRGSGFSRSSTKSLNRATSLKVKTTTTIANNKNIYPENSMENTKHSEATFHHQVSNFSLDKRPTLILSKKSKRSDSASTNDEPQFFIGKEQMKKEESNLL